MRSLRTSLAVAVLAALMPASSSFAQATRAISADLDPSRLVADQLAGLVRDLNDAGSSQDVRDTAARRLLSIGTAEARTVIQGALRDPGNVPARLAAARAIAEDLPPDPEFIDSLFVLMDAEMPKPVLDAATEALGNYKLEPDVSRRLVDLSKPGRPDTLRVAAIRALADQIEKRAAEQLVALTQDSSPLVSAAALEAVRQFASLPIDSPADWWKTQADHSEDRFRLETLAARSSKSESLNRRGEETYLELKRSVLGSITAASREERGATLQRYLKSPRAAVRKIAAEQAYEFATTGDLPDEVRPALREMLADTDADVRYSVARTFWVVGDADAFPAIARQVAVEPDSRVRVELARAMGVINSPAAVPLLRWLLDDASTPVVTAAAGSIVKLAPDIAQADPTAAAELAIRLQAVLQTRANGDRRLRESLLEALVPLKQPAMLSTFKAILTANPRESETMRQIAARGLGAIGEPQMAAILVEAMRDLEGSAAVRAEAAKALGAVSRTFENAEAIYRAMVREPDPAVAQTEWQTIKGLLVKAPKEQLARWPSLPLIQNNDERTLDVYRQLEKIAAAERNAPDRALGDRAAGDQTYYLQQIGDTLMRMGEAAEAKQDAPTARQRFAEATTEYQSGLTITRATNGPAMRIETLIVNAVKSLLRARDYAGAAKFASDEFRGPSGNSLQGTIGPEFKLEAERLADPNRANQLDDALSLIREALAMSPSLAEMYRGHLLEVQRDVDRRQREKNEYAWPEFMQSLAMLR